MIHVLKADLFKVGKSKAFLVIFIIASISALIMAISSHMVSTGDLSLETALSFPALFIDSQMISLLGCVTVGLVVCTDFENKAISSGVAGGLSRLSIVMAKTLLTAMLTSIIFLPYAIVTMCAFVSDYSFAAYIQTPLLNIMASQNDGHIIGQLAPVMLMTALLYAAQLCICTVVMFITKKPIITLAVSYVLLLFFASASHINDSLKTFMGLTPFDTERLGTLTLSMPSEAALTNILIAIVFIATTVALSYLFFRKVDLE